MKKTKGFVSMLMVCMLVFSCSIMSFAAAKAPVLSLEKNEYNSSGDRHIKVSWQGTSGTYQLQLDDDENFGSPVTKKRTSSQGKYYNFVLSDNVDDTYYVRVRLGNGEWSNVIAAEMENTSDAENNGYLSIPNVPSIPNISGSITFPNINLGNLNIPLFRK